MGKKEFDAELKKRFGDDFSVACPNCKDEISQEIIPLNEKEK